MPNYPQPQFWLSSEKVAGLKTIAEIVVGDLAVLSAQFVRYDLCHSFATRFYESCPNDWTLAKILGHFDTKTNKRYVHPTRDSQKAGMARFEQAMSEAAKDEMAG